MSYNPCKNEMVWAIKELTQTLDMKGGPMPMRKLPPSKLKDFLGRGHYERTKGDFKGYRNGYEPRRLKDIEGELELMIPQVRQAPEPFIPKVA